MNANFAHLHLHSQYSILEGAIRIESLPKRLIACGIKACAITDHGNMHGVIEFYESLRKHNIKPIIGQGFYMQSFFRGAKAYKDDKYFSVNILCKDKVGYKNLLKLSSFSYKNLNTKLKPTLNFELLKKYKDGLIIISPGIESEIGYLLKNNDVKKAEKILTWFLNNFSTNFFNEIYPLTDDKDNCLGSTNNKLYEFCLQKSVDQIVSNNCLYPTSDMAYSQYILTLVGLKQKITQPDALKFQGDLYSIKTLDQMHKQFSDLPEVVFSNTWKVAEMCEVDLTQKKYLLPKFDPPNSESPEIYFKSHTKDCLLKRFENISLVKQWSDEVLQKKLVEYQARLEQEMKIIIQMGYIGYFMIVADFVGWAKKNEIVVGPGRGSGAGSLVAYSLGITDIDPLEYNLLFERFLNVARISMPDFDIDFETKGREKVIEYVRAKYGSEKVAQISATGTLQAKAVIRAVARVLDIPYMHANRIAQLIPNILGINLKKAISQSNELKSLKEEGSDEERKLIGISLDLEGLKSNLTTHAAGVVIMNSAVSDNIPICLSNDQQYWQTQYQMNDLESQGAVKFDFLGLKNLSIIEKTIKLINKIAKFKNFKILEIPLNDSKVYKFISRGLTAGIFQLESDGMKNFVKQFKPQNFDELIALIGIYRPGPLQSGMAEEFIKCKHDIKKVKYQHSLLEPILKSTYGVIIYQEQVMLIAQTLANLSLNDADILRRAMGKKKASELAELKNQFINGCIENNIDQDLSEKIFSLIEKFAGYGFNKSHSVAYGLISYQTAYLKTNFKFEFMSALMSFHFSDQSYLGMLARECLDLGLELLGPSINLSQVDFQPEKDKIRYGLCAIKNLGVAASQMLVNLREELNTFVDIESFYNTIDLSCINAKGIEALIKSGALDELYPNRKEHLENYKAIIKSLQDHKNFQKSTSKTQGMLFDAKEISTNLTDELKPRLDFINIFDQKSYVTEIELLGCAFSKGPLSQYSAEIDFLKNKHGTLNLAQIKENITKNAEIKPSFDYTSKDGQHTYEYTCAINIRKFNIKRQKTDYRSNYSDNKTEDTNQDNIYYAILTLEDGTAEIESWIFEPEFSHYKYAIEENNPALVKIIAKSTKNNISFRVKELKPLEKLRQDEAEGISMQIEESLLEEDILKLEKLIKEYANNQHAPKKIQLHILFKNIHKATIKYEFEAKVNFDVTFCAKLNELFFDKRYRYLYTL